VSDHGPNGLERLLGPTGRVGHSGRLAPALVLASLVRQLPDRPALEVVMQMAGYRSPAYRLCKLLAQQRRALEGIWATHSKA